MSELSKLINCQVGGVLRVAKGQYTIDEPVTVRCSVVLEPGAEICVMPGFRITMASKSAFVGDGTKPIIRKKGGEHLFWIAGSDVALADFEIDNSQATGGFDFVIDTSAGREYIYLDRIRTNDSFGLIADTNNPAGIIVKLYLRDVVGRRHRGRGAILQRAFAFIFFRDCCIDYIGNASPALANIPAFAFVNVEGLELESCDVLGTTSNGISPLQYGFYFENCRAVTLNKVMADNCGGFGFTFKGCTWVFGDKVKSSQGGDLCFVFGNGTQHVFLSQTQAAGRKGLPVDASPAMYWTDDAVDNINFTDAFTHSFSGPQFGGSAQSHITFTHPVVKTAGW